MPDRSRDRLRELIDAVVEPGGAGLGDMAARAYVSPFHFSREVRRFTGESPAALRRRLVLERAAWRLQRGASVTTVAIEEGWSSSEAFSRAFSRAFGVPPTEADPTSFRLPAPNGLHFHPPSSLWVDALPSLDAAPDVSLLMLAHDVDETHRLLEAATTLSGEQWHADVAPGQTVLSWDGPETSVGQVLRALVGTKRVWLASILGEDVPRPVADAAGPLLAQHAEAAERWTRTIGELSRAGRLADTIIDALCDPPESFQLAGIVAHVLTFSAHRRQLLRPMLARHGVDVGDGDPLAWMRAPVDGPDTGTGTGGPS